MKTEALRIVRAALCAALLAAPAAMAATITVDSLGDGTGNDGVRTLRKAITAANTHAASFAYTVNGVSQTKLRTRERIAPPGATRE
jgi:hypothetical protein